MNRDKLLELAKEAGHPYPEADADFFERFAALLSEAQEGEPVAWMTHHDEPMLFPTETEAAAYCEDDEHPIPLYTAHPSSDQAWNEAIDQTAYISKLERLLEKIVRQVEPILSNYGIGMGCIDGARRAVHEAKERALARPSQAQEQQVECNACDWKGNVSESRMLGSVGPLCPECGETAEPAASGAVGERGTFELTKSIIHKCPAIKLPQSFLQRLGNTAQIVALKGADDEMAKAIVDALNVALSQQSAQALPERDKSKPAEEQGLFRKFDIRRVDGSDRPGGKHYGCRPSHAATGRREMSGPQRQWVSYCPFCGSEPTWIHHSNYFDGERQMSIGCCDFRALGREAELIDKWNRRAALQPTEQPASHPVTMGEPVYAVFDGTERIAITTLKENANHVARQTAGAVVVPCQITPVSGVIAPVQPEAAQDCCRHGMEMTQLCDECDEAAQDDDDLTIAYMHGRSKGRRDAAQVPKKPDECANGCPQFQVCDYCQGTGGKDVDPVVPQERAAGPDGFVVVQTEPPSLGEYWECAGGAYAGIKRASNGYPDYHLVIRKVIVAAQSSEQKG